MNTGSLKRPKYGTVTPDNTMIFGQAVWFLWGKVIKYNTFYVDLLLSQ